MLKVLGILLVGFAIGWLALSLERSGAQQRRRSSPGPVQLPGTRFDTNLSDPDNSATSHDNAPPAQRDAGYN